jgi:aspartate/methionine/tyrosine aminotransferase
MPRLREAIATKVRSRNGIDAGAENVVVTPGGIAGLYVATLAQRNPGDEILVLDPGWPNYRVIAGAQHLTVGVPDGTERSSACGADRAAGRAAGPKRSSSTRRPIPPER